MPSATSTTAPGPAVTTYDLTLSSAEASGLLAIMNFISASSAPAPTKALASGVATALTNAGAS